MYERRVIFASTIGTKTLSDPIYGLLVCIQELHDFGRRRFCPLCFSATSNVLDIYGLHVVLIIVPVCSFVVFAFIDARHFHFTPRA